jgi:exodeoxyribonuclease V alpha subunit
MIDTDLMASLISACIATTHILLVGDANQLAPVGHGKPFLDLQMCIPTGHLTEIRRNSGQIVRSCAEIRDKGTITFSTIRSPEDNLLMIPCEDMMPAIESTLNQITAEGDDIVNDVQVMTAKNVHRRELNGKLQRLLNPVGEQIKGNPFRIADKVVCLTNGRYPSADDHDEEIFVANGELGYVVDLQPGRMKVELFDPERKIMVFHTAVSSDETKDDSDTDKGAVGDWDLGYCLSVHRSQGSQWKHVIVTIEKGAEMIHSKNWLFTAISRAEKYTILIGDRRLVGQMLKKNGLQSRVTRLEDRYRTLWMRMNVSFDDLFASV